jgi:hypothetical protein
VMGTESVEFLNQAPGPADATSMTAMVFPFPNTQTVTGPCVVCCGEQRMRVSAPGLLGSLVIPCPACTARGAWLLRTLVGVQ